MIGLTNLRYGGFGKGFPIDFVVLSETAKFTVDVDGEIPEGMGAKVGLHVNGVLSFEDVVAKPGTHTFYVKFNSTGTFKVESRCGNIISNTTDIMVIRGKEIPHGKIGISRVFVPPLTAIDSRNDKFSTFLNPTIVVISTVSEDRDVYVDWYLGKETTKMEKIGETKLSSDDNGMMFKTLGRCIFDMGKSGVKNTILISDFVTPGIWYFGAKVRVVLEGVGSRPDEEMRDISLCKFIIGDMNPDVPQVVAFTAKLIPNKKGVSNKIVPIFLNTGTSPARALFYVSHLVSINGIDLGNEKWTDYAQSSTPLLGPLEEWAYDDPESPLNFIPIEGEEYNIEVRGDSDNIVTIKDRDGTIKRVPAITIIE